MAKHNDPRQPGKDSGNTAMSATGTVHRVLRLLNCFGDQSHWSVNELASALDLPAPTVHRLLGLARTMGYIAQRADGRYEGGAALFRLAARLASEFPLNQIAAPYLEQLRDETQETALLTVLARSDLQMFFSQLASPANPMRYSVELNRLWPLSWGATGRSLMAFLSEPEIEAVIERAEVSPCDGRPLSRREVLAALKTIREARFAQTFAQRTPGSYGLAAPFFSATGQVVGNLALTIPDFRFGKHDPERLKRMLMDSAERLSRQLGFAGTIKV